MQRPRHAKTVKSESILLPSTALEKPKPVWASTPSPPPPPAAPLFFRALFLLPVYKPCPEREAVLLSWSPAYAAALRHWILADDGGPANLGVTSRAALRCPGVTIRLLGGDQGAPSFDGLLLLLPSSVGAVAVVGDTPIAEQLVPVGDAVTVPFAVEVCPSVVAWRGEQVFIGGAEH